MRFFFQAEDGIRDHCVTGVQTCALPILSLPLGDADGPARIEQVEDVRALQAVVVGGEGQLARHQLLARSQERRVGKECRSRWSPYYDKRREHVVRYDGSEAVQKSRVDEE